MIPGATPQDYGIRGAAGGRESRFQLL